jgi:glutathione peroxidase
MTPRLSLLGMLMLPLAATVAPAADAPKSVHEIAVKTIDGQDVKLDQYKGKVLLVVNTASQCGYTPQYQGMQAVYEKYKEQGLEVLAFPANEFGGQEPGSNDEIKTFCTMKYRTTFPLFAKIVVAGEGKHPLYQYLTAKETNPKFAGDIPWNFTKFLVGRDGQVIARFEPKDAPESAAVTQAIEAALAGK